MKSNKNPVVALLCADLHISHRPPTARTAEEDWYAAQRRPFDQLTTLAKKHHCPVICAGDIFDRWNPPPECINFALHALPPMYAVPGQHDLPNHDYQSIKRSAYWTLVKAGKITNLVPGLPLETTCYGKGLRLWGFPWGTPVQPLKDPHDLFTEIAVIHAYIWTRKAGYEGAPKEARLSRWEKRLIGYDLAVFGDNHSPFDYYTREANEWEAARVFNCGGFQRRRSDEQSHRPSVGMLHADSTIERHYLDCSQDRFVEKAFDPDHSESADVEGLIELLKQQADSALDFATTVRQAVGGLSPVVRKLVLEMLEGEQVSIIL